MIELVYKEGDKIVKKTFNDCDNYLIPEDNSIISVYNTKDSRVRTAVNFDSFISVTIFGGENA